MSLEVLDKQNIRHDRFDSKKFQNIVFQSELKKNLIQGIQDYRQFPELFEDLFYSLYKYAPRMEEAEKIDPTYQMNRDLVNRTMSTHEFKKLRVYSKMNDLNSALGSANLAENILKDNEKLFDQMKQQQKQKQQLRKQLKQLQKELQKAKKASKNKPSYSNLKLKKELGKKINQKLQQAKKIGKSQQKTKSQISVIGAIRKTSKQMKAQSEMFDEMGFGAGTGSGKPVKVELKERLEFSKLYVGNKHFKKLIELIGRMKRLAVKKQKNKSKHAVESISDIHQSDDLARIIPAELFLLAEPELEMLFYKKFAERQLLSYKLRGKEKQSKGPIIACLDVSGSMSGDPDRQAKAIAIGLVEIAHRQKREAVVILFDHGIRKEWEFPKNEPYWENVKTMAEFFSGGGTSFTEPLKRSMEYFQKDEKFKKADLVWITDGNGYLDEEISKKFGEFKKLHGINVFTLLIGGYGSNHNLKPISDVFNSIDELTPEVAGNLFESL